MRELLSRGNKVTGMTRSPERVRVLEQLGAQGMVAGALDAEAAAHAIKEARPLARPLC